MLSKSSFAKIANSIELGKYLHLSFSEESNGGRNKPSLLSDAFEAIIGTIYLESGIDATKNIVHKLLKDVYGKIDMLSLLQDYKTTLQEITQAKFGVIPTYEVIDSSGPDHKKKFTIQIKIGDKIYAKAIGNSKKQAQQLAAQKAITILKGNK